MEEPSLLIKDCDMKRIDGKFSINQIEVIPKIRKKAEALADKLKTKVDELGTHELDEEIKELQSILDDLQRFGIMLSFSVNHSTKNPYPSLNGATDNPGAISIADDSVSDDSISDDSISNDSVLDDDADKTL